MSKAQASIELMVTLGVVLAFTIPVIFLLFSITSVGYENAAVAQADASARSFADTINLVYAQGPGAKRTILMNVPSSTQNITVLNGEVIITLKLSTGFYEATAPTFANMSKVIFIEKKTGLFPVIISVNKNTQVEISEK